MQSRGLARDLLGSIGAALIVCYGISRLLQTAFDWRFFLCIAGPYVAGDLWRAIRRRMRRGKDKAGEEVNFTR